MRLRVRTCSIWNRFDEKLDRLLPHHNATGIERYGDGRPTTIRRAEAPGARRRAHAAADPRDVPGLIDGRSLVRRAIASCSKVRAGHAARCRPRHLSVRDVVEHGRRCSLQRQWPAGPDAIDYVLGITKAYTTRVGAGPFPTELFDESGRVLGERGNEFGASTGRQRRCGWFDAVAVRRACILSGVTGLCLTKLDVMDTLAEVFICTHYDLDGERLDHPPIGGDAFERCTPVYERMPGWQAVTAGANAMEQLPDAAATYVRRLEDVVGVPIHIVSTGPERSENVIIEHPFG